jgi:hypothetical protein
MTRITRAIFDSKYSIHDLSRCQGEGDENLARLNMPLELGIAMARRFLNSDQHDWLVLVPQSHPYARYVSDLAGFDPKKYDGSERSLISALVAWLATRADAVETLSPSQVLRGLPQFRREMRKLRITWGEPPWADVVLAALKIAKQFGRSQRSGKIRRKRH